VAAGGTNIGTKGMIVAGRTLAMTAVDLFLRPDLVARARVEFDERIGSAAPYRTLVGDREPPLDYRVNSGN
jgi:aminobenzoyl-glutamate utilization protein B